ncbi:MarR family winged helix-turn-helix transcriptional regulator [Streptomyces sp. MS19]|uniref:MarR family winged helix-turn-helix transcriptional regulator n=1 Tax=Streptomyces sp. MS19 TaxID=3385972 RepID=UPI0039A3D67B
MTSSPRWLTPEEQSAWQAYRRMTLLLNARISRELADDCGLSDPDYDVLSTLGESADSRRRVNELADRMLWSRSRLSHHLTRMQQRGLIAREHCVDDGRGALVVLTAEGRRKLEQAATGHVEAVRRHFIDLLTPEEITAFTTIGNKITTHLTTPETT